MHLHRAHTLALALASLAFACTGETDTNTTKRSLLTLSPVSPATRDVQAGGSVTVKVGARTIEGSTITPASGVSVSLALQGLGDIDPETLTLDAEGQGEFTYSACAASDAACLDRLKATVTASASVGGSSVSGNIVFTVRNASAAVECDDSCGAGCEGKACQIDGNAGTCGVSTCVVGAAVSDLFEMEAGLYNAFGEVLEPARVAVSSAPVEVRVLVSNTEGSPVPSADVRITADNGVGLVGLVADAPVAEQALVKAGTTNDKGVFRAFVFPGSNLASGSVVVQAAGLTQRFRLDVVKAGILAFTPSADDTFVRIMGVEKSGYREQNTLRFTLLDTEGKPYVGGATMHFELVGNPGGVSIFPASVRIDENAEASVNLRSGPVAGTVLVRATASVDGDTSVSPETVSDPVAIVGAKVNGRNIAVKCEKRAVPALWENDCSFMRIDENTLCTAVLGDRYNNAIGRQLTVAWSTEAGLFGPPSSTPEADPDSEPETQGNLGRTSNTLRSLNARLPQDVPAITGVDNGLEPSRTGEPGECPARDGGVRTFNPRDGLVTFIVHTKGEEGFWDRNNNGEYDAGEEFIDLGEPFVDANDNNLRDANEEFVDTNNNGSYDGPNGVWDANTTLWAVGHVLYTNTAQLVEWNPTAIAPLLPEGRASFVVTWSDENFNAPARSFSSYGFELSEPSAGSVAARGITENIADSFGFRISQITECAAGGVCSLKTQMAGLADVNGYSVLGLYSAPDEGPASDLIRASATLSSSSGSTLTIISGMNVETEAP